MRERKHLARLRERKGINLTPLMDLTFILLITFIITYPLIEQGIPLNLPKAKGQDLKSVDAHTISINRLGLVHLDNFHLTLDELRRRVTALGKADPDVTIMVRADDQIRYGRVMEVLKILHGASISRMALVTQADEGESP